MQTHLNIFEFLAIEETKCSINDINEKLGIDTRTISECLNKLVKDGYVTYEYKDGEKVYYVKD